MLIPTFSLATLTSANDELSPETIELLVVSDIHGWVHSEWDFPRRKPYGIAPLLDMRNEQQREAPQLLTVSAGDSLSGSILSQYYIAEDIPWQENGVLKSFIQLEPFVATVGNHDVEFYDYHRPFMFEHRDNFISSNLTDSSGQLVFKGHKAISLKDRKLYIVGITTSGTNVWSDPSIRQSVRATEPAKALRRELEAISPRPEDIVVGLLHTGMNPWRDFQISLLNDEPPFNAGYWIARDFPRLDLIIAGHDHRLSPGKDEIPIQKLFGTPIVEGGYWGQKALRLSLSLFKPEAGRIASISHKVLDSGDYDAPDGFDSSFLQNYQEYMAESTGWIMQSKEGLGECLEQELAKAVSDLAQGSALPPLSVDPLFLRKGQPLLKKHLHFWMAYPNTPVRLSISYADLNRLLELAFPKEKAAPYNNRLNIFWQGRHLTPETKDEIFPEMAHASLNDKFQRSLDFVVTNYHANGGGGVKARLLLKEDDTWQRGSRIFQELLFEHLRTTNPPEHCSMFTRN